MAARMPADAARWGTLLEQHSNRLSYREREIMRLRYSEEFTYEKIAYVFRVTRERIRSIEKKAKQKLEDECEPSS